MPDLEEEALEDVAEATHFFLCSASPSTYTEASDTYALGVKSQPELSTPSGGEVILSPILDGQTIASGTATHWALVNSTDSTLLISESLSNSVQLTEGQVFTSPQATLSAPGGEPTSTNIDSQSYTRFICCCEELCINAPVITCSYVTVYGGEGTLCYTISGADTARYRISDDGGHDRSVVIELDANGDADECVNITLPVNPLVPGGNTVTISVEAENECGQTTCKDTRHCANLPTLDPAEECEGFDFSECQFLGSLPSPEPQPNVVITLSGFENEMSGFNGTYVLSCNTTIEQETACLLQAPEDRCFMPDPNRPGQQTFVAYRKAFLYLRYSVSGVIDARVTTQGASNTSCSSQIIRRKWRRATLGNRNTWGYYRINECAPTSLNQSDCDNPLNPRTGLRAVPSTLFINIDNNNLIEDSGMPCGASPSDGTISISLET